MFEQQYKRANDRIHPRKDLLKEMQAKWAEEEARQAEEERKVVAFPTWAKYVSVAAGVLLCVGLGMGSMLLYSRSRGMQNKSAAAQAEAPMMMAESRVEAQEEAKILTATTADMAVSEDSAAGAAPEIMLGAPAYEAPKGMHRAADEAEVEDALRYGFADQGRAEEAVEAEMAAPQAKAASNAVETAYPAGQLLIRDDLMLVFLPTTEQVRVIQYANHRAILVFSLGLREKNADVKQVFWMGSEMLAVRARAGDTELIRFDVTDWKAPKHRMNLTQSGTFLGAGELDGRIYILSLYKATDQEPRPWVNGERIDFADVLLDGERPGDVYTVLTVYDPAQGDFVSETALLLEAEGGLAVGERLYLWTGAEEASLFAFDLDGDGLTLTAEKDLPGAVADAGTVGSGLGLLLQTGDGAALLTLDEDLTETGSAAAQAGAVRWGQVFEDGAAFLTDSELHWLAPAGDWALEITGDGLRRLSEDRLLVFSADGKLQLVALAEDGLKALGTAEVRKSLALLLEDPDRMDYDPATKRLALPAGQAVVQYRVTDAGELVLLGTPLPFTDHDETDQREIRCRMTADGVLVFYRSGVVLCNQILERQLVTRY